MRRAHLTCALRTIDRRPSCNCNHNLTSFTVISSPSFSTPRHRHLHQRQRHLSYSAQTPSASSISSGRPGLNKADMPRLNPTSLVCLRLSSFFFYRSTATTTTQPTPPNNSYLLCKEYTQAIPYYLPTYLPTFNQWNPSNKHQAAINRLKAFNPPPSSYNLVPLERRAAVLLLLYADAQGDLRVVLTIRASTLSSCMSHPLTLIHCSMSC